MKLFSDILNSSVWFEDANTRLVWITLLLLSDEVGHVRATARAVAHQARVPVEDAEMALEKFAGPDPDSRTPDNDGRRVERVDGGFLLLNYAKYRAIRDAEHRREYMRQYMARRRVRRTEEENPPGDPENADVNTCKHPCKHPLAKLAQAEAEAEAYKTPLPPKGGRGVLPEVPESLNTAAFLAAWAEWITHRREIRHSLKPTTAGKQLEKLAKAGPEVAVKMIGQSIENGWQGLFDLKDERPKAVPGRARPPSKEERLRREQEDEPAAEASRERMREHERARGTVPYMSPRKEKEGA